MDDDEEPQDQPPFRWNWQAVFMLCFFILAMAIPVAGVLLLAQGYFEPAPVARAAAAPEVDTGSLEKGLERVSETQFADVVTISKDEGVELSVAGEDLNPRTARILEIAKEAGGSGLEMGGMGEGAKRVMIQVPASRRGLLRRAILGERVDFSAIPAGAAMQLLEVNLRTP